jgi:hypothetical protein
MDLRVSGWSSGPGVDSANWMTSRPPIRLDLAHRFGRRIVGDEMADQLGGEEAMRRGMAGQERQCGGAAGLAGREGLLKQGLAAGLVREWPVAEARRVGFQIDRPAGEDIRERCHVRLGVSGRRADGVQFQGFARQSLVKAAMGALPGRAVGTERGGVVEVEQHGWMAHHRQDHVAEWAGDVGADRFFDEGGGDGGAFAAAQGHDEMVGPEPDQTLAKRGRGRHGLWQLRRGLDL